jgi:hypothetical protein
MMRKTAIALSCAALLPALISVTGCDDSTTSPGDPDTVTVVFRDGVSPNISYTGTGDAVIRNGPSYAMRTSNNGQAPADTLGLVDIEGSIFERRMLVRFDLTSITDCGTVASALLTIRVVPEDTNRTVILDAYEVTTPVTYPGSWIEGFMGDGVSWIYLDGVSQWTSEGGDVLGLFDSREVKADTAVTFELAAARVEAWIKIPSRNHGILLKPRASPTEVFLHAYMRESAAPDLRPELHVKYIKGG